MDPLIELVSPVLSLSVLQWSLLIAGTVFLLFVLLVLFAHLPVKAIELLESSNAPEEIKAAGKRQFWIASAKAYFCLPFDLAAPFVVPFLLLFTKSEDDRLKIGDSLWGNDASINGDIRLPNSWELRPISNNLSDEEEISLCYWAKGHHPRSFYARFVWLGLRNRASALSQRMGAPVFRGDGPESNTRRWWSSEEDHSGNTLLKNPDRPSFVVTAVDGLNSKPVVSIFAYSPSVFGKHRRIYFGYKIPLVIPQWKKAQVASVGWSLR